MRIARSTIQWLGLWAAPVLAISVYLLLPDSYVLDTGETIPFSSAGRATAAIAVWMAVWWMSEAIPVYATALLPLALLPLTGAADMRGAATPYGHELIFLFLGGFILALGMERWNLHRRIALTVLRRVGTEPSHMVGGFLLVTAALSMWVSNTATAVMMLPIAVSVIELVVPRGNALAVESDDDEARDFAVSLLLAVAYGASLGGIATLIGTPPNLFMASYVKTHLGVEIGFARWMLVGLPLALVFLALTWWLLTRVLFPVRLEIAGGRRVVARALAALGPLGRGEKLVGGVFLATAAAWIGRPLLVDLELGGMRPLAGLTDPGIAILAALTLFLLPVDREKRVFAMDWPTAARLPWGLLLLFGGGLSLASAIRENGVGEWLGHQVVGLAGWPTWVLVLAVTALVIFLTELTSNTATTATLIPILAALAPGLNVAPTLLIVPAALAASCAFMLPVATPPNAIVFGSGHVSIPQMCRAGWWLNLIGVGLITLTAYLLALPILGTMGG